MKYCKNCGKELQEKNNFCTLCGTPVSENATTIKPNNVVLETVEDKKKGNVFGIIALILHFGTPFLTSLLSPIMNTIEKSNYSAISGIVASLIGVGYLSSWVIMIVGRVKYPKNVLCKVTMWIFIITAIMEVVGLILIMAFCYITCTNMDFSGCY
jgi:hypothetical protein